MKDKVHFSPVILDPNTANPWLYLSDDLTSVTNGDTKQQLPDNPERNTDFADVHGSEGFSSGKHSWEVEVGDHPSWSVGLVKESAERKGERCASPKYGIWCLLHPSGKYTDGLGKTVKVKKSLQRIRVQLDYDRGDVSFYDPEDMTHIYTYRDTFTEKLFPYFYIGEADLDSVKTLLTAQDQKIQLHEAQLTNISSGIKELTDSHAELKSGVDNQVRYLAAQLQQIINQLEEITNQAKDRNCIHAAMPPAQPSASPRPVQLAFPEKYSGESHLLPGAPIPKARLYSISGPERKAMDEYIEASLRSGIIRPSSSPAGAGFFFFVDKDDSLRPCIDYSALNDITVKNRNPLPLISSAFEQLQQAKIFTKLDLQNAYYLVTYCLLPITYYIVRIRDGDEWKTGFNTPTRHYEYLRHVRQVLLRLLENQLYVKAEKSEFHASSVSFLGFIVVENQVKMDPEKVSELTNWLPLTTQKKVQQFLGFANFYCNVYQKLQLCGGSVSCTNLF
ncbi:hypothetical protein L3Q82_006832 [Scortum barcoo]|uniref:Uncharacterized protein n=1 Tax=Scortum barcoo TaxID=214431 RepID=A0ACB8WW64_9TELE|nr:hypothetical protein L3Q82_006832 [Scortum barcoo]